MMTSLPNSPLPSSMTRVAEGLRGVPIFMGDSTAERMARFYHARGGPSDVPDSVFFHAVADGHPGNAKQARRFRDVSARLLERDYDEHFFSFFKRGGSRGCSLTLPRNLRYQWQCEVDSGNFITP